MAAKKRKYYVVWEGLTPGIYDTWAKCQLQIKGYAGAKYKSYTSKAEAQAAYDAGYQKPSPKSKKVKKSIATLTTAEKAKIEWHSISVDAACSGSPGIMEYRGVWTEDAAHIFHQGPFPLATNNIGEFLALVHGISYLHKHGLHDIPIYSDSRTALSWLRHKKVKTTLVKNNKTKPVHQLIERALRWLQTHEYKNPILKWDTENWGEIPADFGRK